ncbi:MAG: hypothetical protein ACYDFU_00030, partial [Nitrospirota bacterium]
LTQEQKISALLKKDDFEPLNIEIHPGWVKVDVYHKDDFLTDNLIVEIPCEYIKHTIKPLLAESGSSNANYHFETDLTDDHGNESKQEYMWVKISKEDALKTNWENMTPAMILRLFEPEIYTKQAQQAADKISSE